MSVSCPSGNSSPSTLPLMGVGLKNDNLSIRQQSIREIGVEIVLQELMTEESCRTIPLGSNILSMHRSHRRCQRTAVWRAGRHWACIGGFGIYVGTRHTGGSCHGMGRVLDTWTTTFTNVRVDFFTYKSTTVNRASDFVSASATPSPIKIV